MSLPIGRTVFGVLVLVFAPTLSGRAAPPDKVPLTVEDLYKLDAPRDAALAPDGESLVYVRQWIADKVERNSLWRIAGDIPTARPMEAGEPDARAPVYSPDGKWIAFVSTRPRPAGWAPTPTTPPQSDPATDIWLIPAAGGAAIPLAGKDKPYGRVFNDGFYGRLAFSPGGSKLAFVADDGRDSRSAAEKANGITVVRDDQGEGYTGWGAAQVWVAHLDAEPGTSVAIKIDRLTDDDVWYGDPNWSPDGKTLAVHANRSADRESVRFSINKNFDIWLIDRESKKITQATSGPGPEVSPRFSPDGKRIACLSVPRKGTHRDEWNLAVIDVSGPKPTARVLFDHHDATKDATGYPRPIFPLPVDCWDGDGHLFFTAEAGADNETARASAETGRSSKLAPTLPKGGPPKSPSDRLFRRLWHTPEGNVFLKGRLVAVQKVVSWKSDEFTIEGVLTLPPKGVAKPPYKLLVHPHGGPHGRSAPGFDFTVQLFAARGYAVFQSNFRGSTGYGQKFIDADRGDFGGGDMRDIMTGVDKLITDGIADKDRLFVYGTSYGGFMTTWLVGQTNRFRAAVAQNAVTDLNMMWSLSDLQSWTEWEFGGKPWEASEKYRKHSPLTYADKVKTPTLILHAHDDRRCPLPMGRAYHAALKARGVPTGLVIYPDEGHGIKQPRHREDVLRRVLEWFETHDKK